MGPLPYHRIRRLLGRSFFVALALLALAWTQKGRLIGHREIDSALLRPPVQSPTERAEFSFPYAGQTVRVEPVSSYELRGLVVSHNDIESFADIYHDSSSIDTKDLCVLWGPNLRRDDFRRVKFWSGPWTCYFRYPPGIEFSPEALGNNHLITADAGIRAEIARVRRGDQVRLAGLLVNYQLDDWGSFWRRTSTVREDAGCEIVYVEELEVLRPGTPGWYRAYDLAKAALFAIPPLYLLAVYLEVARRGTGELGRI